MTAQKTKARKSAKKTTVEEAGVTITTLPNGFRIATAKAAHMNKATVGVWTDVGSRYEKARVNGVAHHLEHMIFKGTKNRTAREIAENLEDMGVGPNAYTTKEETAYFAEGLAEHMPACAEIIADILLNSTFPADEMKPEKGAIAQEKDSYDDDPDAVFDDMEEAGIYGKSHPMGRTVLGTHATIKAISRKDLQDFIDTHYTPDNMIMCAAGDVDHDKLVAIAEKTFGKLKPGTKKIAPKPARLQAGDTRKHEELNQLTVSLSFDAPKNSSSDRWAWQLFATALGGGMSSPLFQEVREKRGLVYDVGASYQGADDHGIFSITAGTSPEKAATMMPVICDTLRNAAKTLNERDLKRAKNQLKTIILGMQDSSMHRCEVIASQLFHGGHVRTAAQIQNAIDSVKLADIQRVARQVVKNKMHLTSYGQLDNMPGYDEVKARLKTSKAAPRRRKAPALN